MASAMHAAPIGLRLLDKLCVKCCRHQIFNRMIWHQTFVLFLTYIAYMCYHLTRKPISVVKNILSQNCSNLAPPPDVFVNDSNRDTWCDWAPFGKHVHSAIKNQIILGK